MGWKEQVSNWRNQRQEGGEILVIRSSLLRECLLQMHHVQNKGTMVRGVERENGWQGVQNTMGLRL